MADSTIFCHRIFFTLIFVLNLFVLLHLLCYYTLASGSYFDLSSVSIRSGENLTICIILGLGLPYLLIFVILLFDFRALILFMASINGLGLFFAMFIEVRQLGPISSLLPLLLLLAIVVCSLITTLDWKGWHIDEGQHHVTSRQHIARIENQQTINQDLIPISSLIVEIPETAIVTQSYGFAPLFEQAIEQVIKDPPPSYEDCLPPPYKAVVKNGDQIY